MNRETKSEMRILRKISIKVIILCLTGLMILSCDRNRNMRGYDFIPDMHYSRAYDTYSENPNFEDSMTMRTPVHGTVPIGIVPFRYTIDSVSRAKAGRELINPYTASEEVIASGKILYTTFCIGCHGPLGKGDGQLFISGLYPLKPREISAAPTVKLRDGEIYHTITLGFGSMGAHGAQIRPADRWKIVHYVRELQRAAQEAGDSIR